MVYENKKRFQKSQHYAYGVCIYNVLGPTEKLVVRWK